MQNTIIKRFENDPRVVTAIISQVDNAGELETFWRNIYLRTQMLYDPTGQVGNVLYQQPYGGVPFSRSWVIGPDQTVVLPQFGYHPQLIIDTVNELLADMPNPADVNGDGVVDVVDLLAVILAWGPCPGGGEPCPADTDGSGTVDVGDLIMVVVGWSA